MKSKSRPGLEFHTGSMADIAFLLLIFFLVTTTLGSEKGLPLLLPPPREENEPVVDIADRNVLVILVNRNNELLVENEPLALAGLKNQVKAFVDNNGRNQELSDSPKKAIVSLKTDRGTRYDAYIQVLDQIKAAYHELRATHAGLDVETYIAFEEDKADEETLKKYEAAREKYPMQISEAEPSAVVNQ